MKLLFKILLSITILAVLYYLLLPDRGFPPPPHAAVQSNEPADIETSLRRAYFTNLNREQIMAHYIDQYDYLPFLRLNYPPEDAQWIIRDQTRSYYLEELVHPLRGSLYINGFIPQDPQDRIFIDGVEYYQKITIRYVPSNPILRVVVTFGSLVILWYVANEWSDLLTSVWRRKN